MNKSQKGFAILIISAAVTAFGCEDVNGVKNTNTPPPATANANTAPPAPSQPVKSKPVVMFTLPMLRAFLNNQDFNADLRTRLQLSVDQISQLQKLSRDERKLNGEDYASESSYEARLQANEKVNAVIGEDKTQQLAALLDEYWSGKASATASATATPSPAVATTVNSWNTVPSDTRVVVNAPAYRMDIFESGRLVKSYKVGIGYPEFPLPQGQRQAKEIIFNPSWVPPDEPWVESSSKVKVGEKVEAGSKLNPLGIAKIPIGSPSLIHGGKSADKIGGFASHGCVGLTDAQLRDFAQDIARLGGSELTAKEIAEYGKNRTETKNVKLQSPVPVELRYETIVVEDGKLHIYRDIYDLDTNTEENLRLVLAKYGVTVEDLSEAEQTQVLKALKEMSRDATGKIDNDGKNNAAAAAPSKTDKNDKSKPESGKVTRTVKGAKEIVIAIAALQSKGYPAPVAFNTGGAKSATPASSKKKG
jgi:lipoprotein-anchoring transpeptidase ErfK/SrfK